jgi:hypothetical protein
MNSKPTYTPEDLMIVNSDKYGHPGPRYPDTSRITNQRSLITNQYPRVIIFAADKYGHICSGAKSIGNVPPLGGK